MYIQFLRLLKGDFLFKKKGDFYIFLTILIYGLGNGSLLNINEILCLIIR